MLLNTYMISPLHSNAHKQNNQLTTIIPLPKKDENVIVKILLERIPCNGMIASSKASLQ